MSIIYAGYATHSKHRNVLMLKGLLFTLLLVFVASAMLTACGNKGPLFIPKAEQPKAEATKESDKKKTKTPGNSTAK